MADARSGNRTSKDLRALVYAAARPWQEGATTDMGASSRQSPTTGGSHSNSAIKWSKDPQVWYSRSHRWQGRQAGAPLEEGPGQSHPLLLAPRQLQAALSHHRAVALGQGSDLHATQGCGLRRTHGFIQGHAMAMRLSQGVRAKRMSRVGSISAASVPVCQPF